MDSEDRNVLSASAAQPDQVLRALADPTRRRVMQLLLREELNVSELVEILRQPQSTVSRHLKNLRDAGLITDRRVGVTTYYRARGSEQAAGDVAAVLNQWLKDQPLMKTLLARLGRVLRERRNGAVGFFDRLGKRWDELRAAAFGNAFAAEALAALLPHDWTVADIGTGTGFLLPILADNFRRVIAIDPAAAMLACARQRVSEQGAANVEFHEGDLGQLPIPDGTCDLAIACLVLHHVPAPRAAIAEIHRVLRRGGRVLVVEQQSHENQGFYELMQDRWWGFDAEELCALMAATGFVACRHHPLRWADGKSSRIEAPSLFALTARRAP